MSAERKGFIQRIVETPKKIGFTGVFAGGTIWFFNPGVGLVVMLGSAVVTVAGAGLEKLESHRPKSSHGRH